jgi:hypothetical protein
LQRQVLFAIVAHAEQVSSDFFVNVDMDDRCANLVVSGDSHVQERHSRRRQPLPLCRCSQCPERNFGSRERPDKSFALCGWQPDSPRCCRRCGGG